MTNGKPKQQRTRTSRQAKPKRREVRVTAAAKLRTPQEAREWLEGQGISIATFAADHGLAYETVRKVLNGKNIGRYGEAHRAAVVLQIKKGTAVIA